MGLLIGYVQYSVTHRYPVTGFIKRLVCRDRWILAPRGLLRRAGWTNNTLERCPCAVCISSVRACLLLLLLGAADRSKIDHGVVVSADWQGTVFTMTKPVRLVDPPSIPLVSILDGDQGRVREGLCLGSLL